MKKKCLFVISSLLLAVALFSWFILKQRVVERKKEPSRQPSLNNQQSQNEEVVDKSVVPKPSYVNDEESKSSDVSTWNEYQNTQYRFTFRYPLEGWGEVLGGKITNPDSSQSSLCGIYPIFNTPVYIDTLFAERQWKSGAPSDLGPDREDICVVNIPGNSSVDSKLVSIYGNQINNASDKSINELTKALETAKPGSVVSYHKETNGSKTVRELFFAGHKPDNILYVVAYITDIHSSYVYELTFAPQYFDYKTDPMIPSDEEYLNTWKNIIDSFQVY